MSPSYRPPICGSKELIVMNLLPTLDNQSRREAMRDQAAAFWGNLSDHANLAIT